MRELKQLIRETISIPIRESISRSDRHQLENDGAISDLVRRAQRYISNVPGCTFDDLLDVMRDVNARLPDEEDEY